MVFGLIDATLFEPVNRTQLAIFAAAAAGACSPGDARVFLPLPPHSGAKAMLVAIDRGSELTMLAADLENDDDALEQSFPDADSFVLEALLYDRTLDELSLSPGTVALDEGADPVADPKEIYVSRIDDARATEWTRSNAPSEAVRNFRPKRSATKRCPTLETAFKKRIGGAADHTFIIPLGEKKVLVGLLDGTIAVVAGDEGRVTQITDRSDKLPIGAAFVDELGDMYFAGRNGDVWKGHYVETSTSARIVAEPLTSSESGDEHIVRYVTGGATAEGFELYTLDNAGLFKRFSRQGWEQLHDFTDIVGTGTKGGLIRVGAGHAVAASATKNEVIRYRNGETHLDNPEGLESGITGVGRTAEGVVVSTGDGFVSVSNEPAKWTSLGQSKITVDVYTFFALPTGFLYGGAFGWIAEKNGELFCEAEIFGAGSIRGIAAYGDGFLLAEDKPQGDVDTSVTLLKRTP